MDFFKIWIQNLSLGFKDTILRQNLSSIAAEISDPNHKNFTSSWTWKSNAFWKGTGRLFSMSKNRSLLPFKQNYKWKSDGSVYNIMFPFDMNSDAIIYQFVQKKWVFQGTTYISISTLLCPLSAPTILWNNATKFLQHEIKLNTDALFLPLLIMWSPSTIQIGNIYLLKKRFKKKWRP